MTRLAVLLLALAAPASAQDQISPEEFIDQLVGKTATFSLWNTGELVGTEQFLQRDRTVWARSDGTCAFGTVIVRDVRVCFLYDDEPAGREHCWIPFVQDGALLVLDDDGSEVQQITRLTENPVACTPPPIS